MLHTHTHLPKVHTLTLIVHTHTSKAAYFLFWSQFGLDKKLSRQGGSVTHTHASTHTHTHRHTQSCTQEHTHTHTHSSTHSPVHSNTP